MGGRWWVILLLLLGVWQVIGTLIEKAGKKHQEQRTKDLAAQRERQIGVRGQSRPAPPATPPTATDRAEALAARRREQLEQLRKRRAALKPGVQLPTSPTPRARFGPAPTAPPQAGRPMSQPRPGPFPTSSTRRVPAPVPVARRGVATPPPTRPAAPRPPSPVTARPAPIQQQEPASSSRVGESSTRRVVMDTPEAPKAPGKRHLPLPFVPGEPMGPHLLRQMVLFREILEPPVSLRDRQVWERL